MAQFIYEQILPYPPKEVFTIFREQLIKTFPNVNPSKAIGATAEKDTKGISGYTFQLNLEITNYQENEIYELTTHASNKQEFVSRYDFAAVGPNNTRLTLTETNTTPGFFGSANAIMASIIFKKRAKQKANKVFLSITDELEKRKMGK